MCGRFTLRAPQSRIVQVFQLDRAPAWTSRYNIAPTQDVFAVRTADDNQREGVLLRWGLIPFWAETADGASRMINARVETVAVKPAFRNLLRKQRCLVVADGYYEWQKQGTKKQPYFIHADDDQPFAFAALWDRWSKQQPPLETCTILTTQADERIAAIHDRMPLVLMPEEYSLWLDPHQQDVAILQELLRQKRPFALRADPVTPYVNNVRNEGPRCIERP
jgi:putative SOS response-associated peptidase YedK